MEHVVDVVEHPVLGVTVVLPVAHLVPGDDDVGLQGSCYQRVRVADVLGESFVQDAVERPGGVLLFERLGYGVRPLVPDRLEMHAHPFQVLASDMRLARWASMAA